MDKQHDSPSGGQPLDEHEAQGESTHGTWRRVYQR